MRIYDEIAERQRGIDPSQLRDDILWRISALMQHVGEIDLTRGENRAAFAEIIDAYVPDGFDFYLAPLRGFDEPRADLQAGGRIAFSGFLTSEGAAVAELARVIWLRHRYANHCHLKVTARYRGNRIAPRTLIKCVGLYDRLGFEQIRLRAAYSGSWYWAQWGFNFANVDDLVRLQRHTQRIVDAFGAELDVSGFIRPTQFFYLGHGTAVTLDDFIEASIGHADQLQEIAYKNGISTHDEIPFGRAVLLTGPAWDGVLNLSSESPDRLIFEDLARKMVSSDE